jgi:hypothetical protein
MDRVMASVQASPQRRQTWIPAAPSLWRIPSLIPGRLAVLLVLIALLLALVTGSAVISALRGPDADWRPPFASWQPTRLPIAASQRPAEVFPSDAVVFQGGYVAVGYAPGGDGWGNLNDVGVLWRSPGGAPWESVEDPSFAGASIFGVATDGQRLVAVGTHGSTATGEPVLQGAAWISTDGLSWRQVRGGPTWFAGEIMFGLDRFFAEGCSGAGSGPCDIWSSADGENWEISPATSSSLPLALYASDRGIVAVGGTGYRSSDMGFSLVTQDGVNWDRSTNQEQLADMAFADVTSVDGRYLAIGQYFSSSHEIDGGSYILTSEDGLSWSRDATLATGMWFSKVLATPSGLIAIGSAWQTSATDGLHPQVLMASRDGTTWEAVSGADNGPGSSGVSVAGWLVRPDGQLLVVGSSTKDGLPVAPASWIAAP